MVFNRSGNGIKQDTMNFLGQERVKYFAAGLVAAYAIKKICETDFAHDAAVNITAGALEIKDTIESGIETIKEDAEDIHAEAQQKQQLEIFGPEDLDDIEDLEVEELDIELDDD